MRDLAGLVFAAILDFKWVILALIFGAAALVKLL
jgi:hypothetical protein